MKNHEINILDYGNTFLMRCGRSFDMLCGVCGTCLKLLCMRSHCVQTCAASNKHISQTRKPNEIPILSHGNTFKMRYSVGSISSCGGREIYLNFMYMQSHYVHTCVASNKRISQTRKVNEKMKNTHFR